MEFYEIIIIILASLFVLIVFGRLIYKKIKGIPTSDCACTSKKEVKKMIDNIRLELDNEKNEKERQDK